MSVIRAGRRQQLLPSAGGGMFTTFLSPVCCRTERFFSKPPFHLTPPLLLSKKKSPPPLPFDSVGGWRAAAHEEEEKTVDGYLWHRGGVVDVLLVPILSDNYAYIFIDKVSGRAGCVDPADPDKVMKVAESLGLSLELLLCTHHHLDHSGGNRKMMELVKGLKVVCSEYEHAVDGCNLRVKHHDKLQFGESVQIEVLYAPCHTAGHVLYKLTGTQAEEEAPVLFSGDTLFVGGCGRFLEGTASEMVHALYNVVGELAPNTLVFCGHEYTLANLRFALSVEPNNSSLQQKYRWAKQRRDNCLPTIPSTISEEFSYNPFMRLSEAAVQSYCGGGRGGGELEACEVMTTLRNKKNVFK
eukprot:GHVS01076115.1.p1 GENE.GHVS01076115.1~~GHVS01076115.1.p1  ORF type:complete len:375 (+),score=75.32 GHVS01076115.1:63-1127(+)